MEASLEVEQHEELVTFIKCLIDNGVLILTNVIEGQVPLIYFSMKGLTRIVKGLLAQNGIDVNAQDGNGNTALIYAAQYNYIEIAKMLVIAGIDLNITNIDGETALMVATLNNNDKIVSLLIQQNGIDLNISNKYLFNIFIFHFNFWSLFDFFTALMTAAKNNYITIARMLVSHGIDVNAVDDVYYIYLRFFRNFWKLFKIYMTALMVAIEEGKIDIVVLLLTKPELKINMKNNEGVYFLYINLHSF